MPLSQADRYRLVAQKLQIQLDRIAPERPSPASLRSLVSDFAGEAGVEAAPLCDLVAQPAFQALLASASRDSAQLSTSQLISRVSDLYSASVVTALQGFLDVFTPSGTTTFQEVHAPGASGTSVTSPSMQSPSAHQSSRLLRRFFLYLFALLTGSSITAALFFWVQTRTSQPLSKPSASPPALPAPGQEEPGKPSLPSPPLLNTPSKVRCWFQKAVGGRLVPGRCLVTARRNVNNHLVYDIKETPNGLERTVVLWEGGEVEVLLNGSTYKGSWSTDADSDIRVSLPSGEFAFTPVPEASQLDRQADEIFWSRYPSLRGQKLQSMDDSLAREWLQIRKSLER